MKKIIKLIILLSFILFLVSCKKENEELNIDFSVFENISTVDEWAVITDPYVAYHEQAGNDTEVSAHGRKGDINIVKGKKYVQEKRNSKSTPVENVLWYYFEQGWLSSTSLQIYSNKFQAEKISNKILNTEKK